MLVALHVGPITARFRHQGRVAQLVERQSNKLPVEGSSPFVTTFTCWICFMFTVCAAFVAQTVERQPFKLLAVGSIPTEGVFCC